MGQSDWRLPRINPTFRKRVLLYDLQDPFFVSRGYSVSSVRKKWTSGSRLDDIPGLRRWEIAKFSLVKREMGRTFSPRREINRRQRGKERRKWDRRPCEKLCRFRWKRRLNHNVGAVMQIVSRFLSLRDEREEYKIKARNFSGSNIQKKKKVSGGLTALLDGKRWYSSRD